MDTLTERQAQTATPPSGPPPHVKLIQLTTGTFVSQAVSVVAKLGVADALANGPRPCGEIASSVGADAATLYRLLRAVADLGVLIELDDFRFELTPVGDLLRSDRVGSMRAWATMVGLPFHRNAWTDLLTTVRTAEPAFQRVHGAGLFAYLAEHPEDATVFDEAMSSMTLALQTPFVHTYDFSGVSTVVDVGGGRGILLATILQANPTLRGVLLDTPAVVSQATAVLQRAGVESRCEVVEGDFFTSVPTSGDLYILANILHDWDDDTASRILRACRAAMSSGRLVILEMVLPEGTTPSTAKLVDLEMLAVTPGGRQRSAIDFSRLLDGAGLRLTRAVPSTMEQPVSFVEATVA